MGRSGEGDVDQKEVTLTTLYAQDVLKDGSLVQQITRPHKAPYRWYEPRQ